MKALKRCTTCKLEKEARRDFYLNQGRPRAECKSCVLERRKREHTPELRRRWNLKTLYGLTPEEFERRFNSQGRRCLGCGTDQKSGRGIGWVVDHDHKTKKFRGILCNSCNLILGHAKDSPNRLHNLACYLRERS